MFAALLFPALVEQTQSSFISSMSEQVALPGLNCHYVPLAVVGIMEHMTKECLSLEGAT